MRHPSREHDLKPLKLIMMFHHKIKYIYLLKLRVCYFSDNVILGLLFSKKAPF